MSVSKYWLALIVLCSLSAHAHCPQIDAEHSSTALNALFEREHSSRNQAILSVALAAEGKLDARAVQSLSQHVENNPNDQYAKLYEGYAWVFSAGEYNRRKNYLRAAEDIKRGFFLIDEAVDSDPDNWRLRYLRLRMDAFVPAELGRYVIALKDAKILSERQTPLPPALQTLLPILHAAALARPDNTQPAETCGLQNMVTVDEINSILVYALEHAP